MTGPRPTDEELRTSRLTLRRPVSADVEAIVAIHRDPDELPGLPLVARIRPANTASQRVAGRAGLTRAAHLDAAGEDGLDWMFATRLSH